MGENKGRGKWREGGEVGERDKGRKFIQEGHTDQKGRSETISLLADTMTDCLEYPQESTLQLLELDSDLASL